MARFQNLVVLNKVSRLTETMPLLIFFHNRYPSNIFPSNNKDFSKSFDFLSLSSTSFLKNENKIDNIFLKNSLPKQSFLQMLSENLQDYTCKSSQHLPTLQSKACKARKQFQAILGDKEIGQNKALPILIKNKHLEKIFSSNRETQNRSLQTHVKNHLFFDNEEKKTKIALSSQSEMTTALKKDVDQNQSTNFIESSVLRKKTFSSAKSVVLQEKYAKLYLSRECLQSRALPVSNTLLDPSKKETRDKQAIERLDTHFISNNIVEKDKAYRLSVSEAEKSKKLCLKPFEKKVLEKSSLLKGNRFLFLYESKIDNQKKKICRGQSSVLQNSAVQTQTLYTPFPEKMAKAFFCCGENQKVNNIILGGIYDNKIIDHNQVERLLCNINKKQIYLRLNNCLKESLNRVLFPSYYNYKIINRLKLRSSKPF